MQNSRPLSPLPSQTAAAGVSWALMRSLCMQAFPQMPFPFCHWRSGSCHQFRELCLFLFPGTVILFLRSMFILDLSELLPTPGRIWRTFPLVTDTRPLLPYSKDSSPFSVMLSTKAITYSNTWSLVLLQENRTISFSFDVFYKPARKAKALHTLAHMPFSTNCSRTSLVIKKNLKSKPSET